MTNVIVVKDNTKRASRHKKIISVDSCEMFGNGWVVVMMLYQNG